MNYRDYVDRIFEDASGLAEFLSDMTKQKREEARTYIDMKKAESERDKAYKSFGKIMYQIETGKLNRDESIVKAACEQIRMQDEEVIRLKAALKSQKDMEEAEDDREENEAAQKNDTHQ